VTAAAQPVAPAKPAKAPRVRVGDRVRVVDPHFVLRVGYPRSVRDYYAQVEQEQGAMLDALLKQYGWKGVEKLYGASPLSKLAGFPEPEEHPRLVAARKMILHQLAYLRAVKDHFGGRQRSLHFVYAPKAAGHESTVASLRTVATGRYFPPSGGKTYDGDYDWEPGGLSDQQAHRLATLDGYPLTQPWEGDDLIGKWPNKRPPEIPTYFLELVQPAHPSAVAD